MKDDDDKLNYVKYFIVIDDILLPTDIKNKKAI